MRERERETSSLWMFIKLRLGRNNCSKEVMKWERGKEGGKKRETESERERERGSPAAEWPRLSPRLLDASHF